MSLLDDAFEEFQIMDRRTIDDGMGGVIPQWTEGAVFNGAITYDASVEMKVAQVLGSTSSYTLTVRKNVDLDYHTAFKRKSDDRIFRIIANSDDRKTPDSAHLNMLQYAAEEWTLS